MPMLAEPVDAVVGVDTHRDTHEVEIALPTGTAIGTRKISNDSSGFAELLASISFSHPGRCRNDAAFAALSGTSPLPASSGRTVPAPAQLRRRPSPEQRHPHHRHHPHAVLPDNQGLRRPTHSRGQVQP